MKLNFILSRLLSLVVLALLCQPSRGTILTFEDFTSNNDNISNVSLIANPFGTGQYGSRAASAINAGFLIGDGWTPNVAISWGVGWQTYQAWPFGNNATTAAGKVAQADYDASGNAPVDITFTPESGFGVILKSFAFTVWNGSPVVPVQIRWTVYGGTAGTGVVLATGVSDAIGSAGGAQTISTGITIPHSSATPVVLRWEKISGSGIYIALNNLQFNQGPGTIAPVLNWPTPTPILVGNALSATQLNATANVPGSFTYTPASGTVLSAGSYTLRADFTPTNPATHSPGVVRTKLTVKENNIPILSTNAPLMVTSGSLLNNALLQITSDVPGSIATVPPLGTVLSDGPQTVAVTFTPTNPIFSTAQLSVSFQVVPTTAEGTIWKFSDPTLQLRPLMGDDLLSYYNPAETTWPASKIAFGSASSFGLTLPTGGDTQVMRFSHTLATEGLKVDFNDPANGSYVDSAVTSNYTLVFDYLSPTAGTARPLYNTNLTNANAAESFINTSNAVQIATLSYGSILPNAWHRIAIVVRAAPAEGQAHLYVDGTFIGGIGSNNSTIGFSYTLEKALLLLTSSTGNAGTGYLSGVRFVGRNLDYAEVHSLGGVHASGPHVAGNPAPRPPFQPLRDPLIIGHRGNSGFAPEDTLPSFLTAFASGADVVEVDIRLTSDARVVVMHDSTIDRTTNGTGTAVSYTLAQLQTFDAGSWFGPAFAGTPPPALREIMAAVKDTYPNAILYLDCKINGLAPRIKDDLDATGFPVERLWFWNYNNPTEAAAVRAVFPTAKLIWGEPNWAASGSISAWPSMDAASRQAVVDGMKAWGVYGFDFGDNEMNTLNATTLQELRAAGFLVSAYTALHPASMTRAVENLGVDAMETDFPAVLRDLLPEYTSTTTAIPLSSGVVNVAFSAFSNPPPGSEIRVRWKPKAAPPSAWMTVSPATLGKARSALVGGLAPTTLYEFQPLLWLNSQPIAFGSVAETTTLTATQNFPTAYAAWQATFPGTGSPESDSDGDGLSNLLEYATGTNPMAAAGVSPTTIESPTQFTVTQMPDRFVEWNVEVSDDLVTWEELLPVVDWQATPVGGNRMQITLLTNSGGAKKFMRSRVTALSEPTTEP